MVPRNAARRHVCERAAKELARRETHRYRVPRDMATGEVSLECLPTRMAELDITFVHTTGRAVKTQGAHKEAGKSVKIREAMKRQHHAKAGTSGNTYATLAHETHGRLEDEAKEQSRMLADEACRHSSMQRLAFVRNLETELSVATVKGNALVFQSCICQLARKTGKAKGGNMPTRSSRIDPASH